MIHIRITEKHDAKCFLVLAKSGFQVVCLPQNTYGVCAEHLRILKREGIPYKKLQSSQIPMPKPALAV